MKRVEKREKQVAKQMKKISREEQRKQVKSEEER